MQQPCIPERAAAGRPMGRTRRLGDGVRRRSDARSVAAAYDHRGGLQGGAGGRARCSNSDLYVLASLLGAPSAVRPRVVPDQAGRSSWIEGRGRELRPGLRQGVRPGLRGGERRPRLAGRSPRVRRDAHRPPLQHVVTCSVPPWRPAAAEGPRAAVGQGRPVASRRRARSASQRAYAELLPRLRGGGTRWRREPSRTPEGPGKGALPLHLRDRVLRNTLLLGHTRLPLATPTPAPQLGGRHIEVEVCVPAGRCAPAQLQLAGRSVPPTKAAAAAAEWTP